VLWPEIENAMMTWGECAYCGAPATTRDHIPPRGTYTKTWPDKPWVPACLECNKGASLDDEYMKRLAMLYGADACQDAAEVGEEFMRSLERPEAAGLRAELLESLIFVPNDPHVPGGVSISLKGSRLEKITDKLVRGWWFKLSGTRLPEDHEIMKYQVGKKLDNPLLELNEKIIVAAPGFYIGDEAFGFRLAYCPESLMTCWLFDFYRVFKIMAYTCEMQEKTFKILDLRSYYQVINHDSNEPKVMAFGKELKTYDGIG
jgi:hypothetical protein